ncbi:MAG: amidohydrolase [Clostridia bacterium]|nr:amidohydrolase [Clostridia bacterium]
MTKNNLVSKIKLLAADVFPQVVDWRRMIHACPELGFAEKQTSKLIYEQLTNLGLSPERAAGTGVTALIQGTLNSRSVVGLRADMDALPVQEETGLEFCSTFPGIMHACGHDAHVAILLGVAKVLTELKDSFAGGVKLIFQPCEESPPGGAIEMIKAGVLENPVINAVLALHVNPHIPAGVIGIKEGVVMAAADVFEVEVIGSGGHGAAPHQTIDPVVIAGQLIMALQTVASRLTDPVEPVVVTIGQINGGTAPNIIPSSVQMKGTCRSLSQIMSKKLHIIIEEIIANIVKAYGGAYRLDYHYGYPPVINHKKIVELVRKAGRQIIGPGKILGIKSPSMGGEDFAYYCEKIPGAFFQLGAGDDNNENHPLHHPGFTLNEESMLVGIEVMALAAVEVLNNLNQEIKELA